MEQQSDALGLHERRCRKDQDGPVNFSQICRPCPSLRMDVGKQLSAMQMVQLTPPETPMSPNETAIPQNNQQSLFRNYLRAFCQFDPSSKSEASEESLLMTAPIRPGDLILVHTVHKNGWADGTVLTTGARGWLPTNYCETFDHPYMRNLLNAMTQFWDLLGANEDANLSAFVRQDYIRGLIAGVRYLLERADCLHREAPLVQKNTGIRRMRKGLLADLSTLVQMAKRLQETISEAFAGEVVHVLLDELVAKAFRVVTRAVGFVDMLAQKAEDTKNVHPTESTASTFATALVESRDLAIDGGTSLKQDVAVAPDSAIEFPPTPVPDESKKEALGDSAEQQDSEKRDAPPSSAVFRPQSGLLAHRLSVVKTDRVQSGTLASEQLARAHDECISHIGAFIGLYLHSRPSSELFATTERLVKACETMLSVMDRIFAHDSQKGISVQQARSNFKLKLDMLTKSTRDVFKFSDGPDDEVVMLPEQTNQLVSVGTSLIRTVGECVVKSRRLIEQAGDFHLDHDPLKAASINQKQATPGADRTLAQQDPVDPLKSPKHAKRLSQKMLPPPPLIPRERAMTSTDVNDFALPLLGAKLDEVSPTTPLTPSSAILNKSLPPLRYSVTRDPEGDALKSPSSFRTESTSSARKYSLGPSIAGSTDTHPNSMRDSAITAVSEVSTRATTPDQSKETSSHDPALINSFGSLSSLRSAAATDASNEAESQLLQKTYANELMLNKDGQVTGGSLPALVEQLTTHDNAPDAQFWSAFFLTFRSFTTPRELAQTLIQRFEYIGDSKSIRTPVRLRIYNVFKGWLETYWNAEADRDALGDIRFFALHKLKPILPQAGERLVDLIRKVTSGYHTGTLTGPLVSGVGKTSMSICSQYEGEGSVPQPLITKSQMNTLRNAASTCSVTDFDPLELARQLAILASKTFCEIQSEELLSLEWNRKNTAKARNVRSMCILNTDLAHVVGDTILAPDDAKKRAVVIKHWSKVAMRCLELNNYDSLMAIMCSLNSSVVQRLRRTWELVSKNTKSRLDELNGIVDFSRNHASLRSRLERPVAPCLPFLGIYLTDLTFVDAGNPRLRELPGTTADSGESISVINFDKHMRMAKIVSHVQKFQVPYKLQSIPEMQSLMQTHLERMREGHMAMVGNLHRRSLVIEPKDMKAQRMPEVRRHTDPSQAEERPKTAGSAKTAGTGKTEGQRFEFFLRTNLNFKARTDLPSPGAVEQK